MRSIKFDYKVYDNYVEIFPDGGIDDNCVYEVRIKKAKSYDGNKELIDFKHEVTTAMTPCYCTVDAVKILLEDFELPVKDMLYYIREASRAADHINGEPVKPDAQGRPPYAVEKYTEIKATLNALLKAYIRKSNDSGLKGTLGPISFENSENLGSIKSMIDMFKKEEKKWSDAIRGYEFEGRNVITTALRSNKTLRPTPISEIAHDMSRNGNLGRYSYHFTSY